MKMDEIKSKSRAQLARDEGYRKELYYDSLNIPTIGIGINLKDGLDDEEIDLLFYHRWEKTVVELQHALPWAGSLDEARFGALVNMAFNMGVPRLLMFVNMLKALEEHRWEDAKIAALNSIWASQVKGRAVRIAKQFETGEWQ